MKFKLFIFVPIVTALLVLIKPNISKADFFQEFQPSASDYGGIGLFQTRSARFAKDSTFEFSRSYVPPYERWLVNIQILPWLEGTFRYTSIENRNFLGGNFIVGTTFKDRAIDFKFLLLEEDFLFPQVALGFQDFLGTGLFSGEYLVASKRFGDLDFSFGVGWGYTAGSGTRDKEQPAGLRRNNPFINFSDSFKSRSSGNRQGGSFAPGAWFSGDEISFFTGIEYFTPIKGLTFKIESDPHNYSSEPVGNDLDQSSNINWGFNYRGFNWLDVAFARQRGEEWMLRFGLRANLNDQGIPKLMDEPPNKLKVRKKTLSSRKSDIGVDPSNIKKNDKKLQPWFYDRYRPSNDNLRISTLRKILNEDGIDVIKLNFRDGSIFIEVFSEFDERSIAQIISTHSDLYIKSIIVKNKNITHEFDINDLKNTLAIDNLFYQLNKSGWQVTEVKINQDVMIVYVIPLLGNFPVRTIDKKFVILPPGIKNIKITTIFENTARDITTNVITDNRKDSLEKTRTQKNYDNFEIKLKRNSKNENESSNFFTQLRDAFTGGSSLRKLFGDGVPYKWNNSIIAENIISDLEEDEIKIKKILFKENIVTVHIFRGRYRTVPKNLGRVLRVVSENVYEDIETINLVLESPAGEVARFSIRREQFEKAILNQGSAQEVWSTASIERPKGSWSKDGEIFNNTLYPDMRWSIKPGIQQHIGGGDQFLLHQLFANVAAKISFADGFDIDAAFALDLFDNFDRITIPSDSRLPKVRSEIKNYLQTGKTTIRKLRVNYMFSPLTDIYTRLTAGYFEMMFGGFGAEVLYRPFGKRYAYGVDINYARKRNFDQLWGFQDFTTKTGHFNFYYNSPFYNINTVTHIGRYLAGDDGITQIFYRRFKSGISSGVWATITNIPFKTFGEGSFDKGFFINVPLDLFSTRENTFHGVFGFRPLTKDGGQMLDIKKLHDHVAIFPDEIARDWKYILE
tara:strand:+ start:27375 stop:30266 length:2892 start_codon:yes stop_codon:yes gene_type:complete